MEINYVLKNNFLYSKLDKISAQFLRYCFTEKIRIRVRKENKENQDKELNQYKQ